MPGERTSVYLAADLAAAVKASGQPLAELIRRGLAAGTAETAQPSASSPASPSLGALPDGDPSHGVLCMGPGCFQRDTRKYGLRQGSRSAPPAVPPSRDTFTSGRYHQTQHAPSAAAQPDQIKPAPVLVHENQAHDRHRVDHADHRRSHRDRLPGRSLAQRTLRRQGSSPASRAEPLSS